MPSKKYLYALMFLASSAHAQETQLILNNGDSLTVNVLEHTTEHVIAEHPTLGKLELQTSQISSMTVLENGKVPTQIVAEVTEEPEEEVQTDSGLFGTGLLTNWDRRFDLGVAGRSGKSKNLQINAGFSADFANDYTRISSQTAYYRAESDGELSAHSFYTKANRDWLRPESPWFHFAGGALDWDEFKDWDYRVGANGGYGYEFYNTDNFLFVGRTGLGITQTFGGEREEFTPEGLLGLEGKWIISSVQKIKFANTLYPNLKESSEFRNLSSFDWILDLNSYAGVALKVGLLNEYDSATEQGISKNDFKYTVSLSWTL